LLIRCHLLRSGLTVGERSLGISDFSTVRKIPVIDTLFQNLSASHCAHVEALLGEQSEFYLVGLDQKQREALEAALVETATSLMASLEREAGTVKRLKIGRWVRIGATAALVFMAMVVKFGGFADHSGKANLALFRTVIVSSHIGGVDHFLVREPRERQVRAFEALVEAGEVREDVRARIVESAERVARFKARLRVPMPASAEALPALLGSKDNQSLADSFVRLTTLSVANSPVVDA